MIGSTGGYNKSRILCTSNAIAANTGMKPQQKKSLDISLERYGTEKVTLAASCIAPYGVHIP